jgi:hypothetical protein
MSSPEVYLLKGPMPELSKMKLKELKEEAEMWRNIWGWVPPEVKYYIARVGQDIGVTLRNYHRYLGTLIDTHWILESVEVGVIDKTYDSVKDKYYFEKKVMVISDNAILYTEWIKERKEWEQLEQETLAAEEKEEKANELKDKKEEAKQSSES